VDEVSIRVFDDDDKEQEEEADDSNGDNRVKVGFGARKVPARSPLPLLLLLPNNLDLTLTVKDIVNDRGVGKVKGVRQVESSLWILPEASSDNKAAWVKQQEGGW
jgi:hypothetical protein